MHESNICTIEARQLYSCTIDTTDVFFTCFIPAIGGVGVLASSPPVNMNMNVNVNMNMNMYMNVNVNVYTVSRCTM